MYVRERSKNTSAWIFFYCAFSLFEDLLKSKHIHPEICINLDRPSSDLACFESFYNNCEANSSKYKLEKVPEKPAHGDRLRIFSTSLSLSLKTFGRRRFYGALEKICPRSVRRLLWKCPTIIWQP